MAMRSDDLHSLPEDVPVPQDDGACAHLPGAELPALTLRSTRGRDVSLTEASRHRRVVVYAYPRTGVPDRDPPKGWNQIPGARGCTPQTCGFRDHHAEFQALDTDVFGLSVQDTAYQQEMTQRLGVRFDVLSDEHYALTRALRLPTFTVEGKELLKRFTLVLHRGRVEHVFYPGFPPGENADVVLAWLRAHPAA
jgi:peroxiredoxin